MRRISAQEGKIKEIRISAQEGMIKEISPWLIMGSRTKLEKPIN
jgi:hypothetical protein